MVQMSAQGRGATLDQLRQNGCLLRRDRPLLSIGIAVGAQNVRHF